MWTAVTSLLSGSSRGSTSSQPYSQPSADDLDASQSPEEDYAAGKNLFDAGSWSRAAVHLHRASDHGHAEAMKYLAHCYEEDKLNDPTQKQLWETRRSDLLSDPEGMCAYAHTLRSAGEHIKAITWFRKSADAGNLESMHQVGVYLRKVGEGEESMVWFRKAAEGGCSLSEVALAEGYEQGIGVERDPAAAAVWRQKIFEREVMAQRVKEEETVKRKLDAEGETLQIEVEQNESVDAADSLKHPRLSTSPEFVIDMDGKDTLRSPDTPTTPTTANSGIPELPLLRGAVLESLNRDYKEAIRLMEWGTWEKAIKMLDRLASQGHPAAISFLDPATTSLKNPTGMLWVCAHFAETRRDDPIIAFSWYTSAMARASKMTSLPAPSSSTSFFLSIPLVIPPEIEQVIADVVPEVRERKKAAAIEKEFRDCLSNLEWGAWAKAFAGLEKLAEAGSQAARDYLNPDKSGFKNPSGIIQLAHRLEVMADTASDEEVVKELRDRAGKWRMKADEIRKRLGGSLPLFSPEATSSPKTSSSLSTTQTPKPGPSPSSAPSQDAQYKTALSNIAWGSYEKGVETLLNLADSHHSPSRLYISPTQSPLKDPAAMYILATSLELRPDAIEEASTWHRRASEAGNHRSMVRLGKLLMRPGGGVTDCWQAVAWFTRSWDVGGNAEAAYEMAIAYARGLEVEETIKKVVKENRVSEGRLIDLSKIGEAPDVLVDTTPQNLRKPFSSDPTKRLSAISLIDEDLLPADTSSIDSDTKRSSTASATAAPPQPKKRKKVIVKQDDVKAVEWARKGASRDHAGCINLLGEMTREGRGGIAENRAAAAQQFKRAAQLGDPVAMFNYGTCLLHGIGVEGDETQALLWLTRATNASKEVGGATNLK
ncbi:hypothetical protein HDU67_003138 [Dinochytrium kinnereticum]|nr:hypothetical protein HDU67_003138 [Dinochytrium kinnereticum]